MTGKSSIKQSLEEIGYDYRAGEPALRGTEWTVSGIRDDTCTFEHQSGATVQIRQRKPRGGDLPFRAIRVTTDNEEKQLGESDWLATTVQLATAYMRGYADSLHSEG